ncbi:MAG: hypothetical protein ACFFFC_15030 [Candidatus Thorarchaeota archaeon]
MPDTITHGERIETRKAEIVAGSLVVVVFLAPYFFSVSSFLGETRLEIHAMTWHVMVLSGIMRVHFDVNAILAGTVFLPLRLIFAYQVYRCYRTYSSRRLTILVGIVAELQVIVVYALATVGNPSTPYTYMYGPIPLLLLIGLVFLYLLPPPQIPSEWVEPSIT